MQFVMVMDEPNARARQMGNDHRQKSAVIYDSKIYLGGRGRCDTRRSDCVLSPEILEPVQGHFRIDRRVVDVLVAKPMLEGSRIVTVIGELEAAGMA